MMPRRWISGWRRWRARCVRLIRAPLEQRRADALGALAHGADRLACECGAADCEAAEAVPVAVVLNVIAEEKSLTDDTAVRLDGAGPPGPTAAQLREMTIAEALAQPPPTGPAKPIRR